MSLEDESFVQSALAVAFFLLLLTGMMQGGQHEAANLERPHLDGAMEGGATTEVRTDDNLCQIDFVEPAVVFCTGQERHGWCLECFGRYAETSFAVGGVYEARIARGDLESAPGQLPCPSFLAGDCSCTALPTVLLRQNLDDEVFESLMQARCRLAVQQARRNEEEAEEAQQCTRENASNLDELRMAVEESLTIGGRVLCPICEVPSVKDPRCMHITCPGCATRWCYCCGRPRGFGNNKCSSCDRESMFLEYNPGWEHCARGTESPGEGAVHEYHCRRAAWFLRQVKEGFPQEQWQELRQAYPTILQGIFRERRIIWDEIDQATLPLFGSTTEDDVLWRNEGLEIREHFLARHSSIDDSRVESNEQQTATEAVVTEATATEAVVTEATATEGAATEAVSTEAVATEAVASNEAVATEAISTEAFADKAAATEAAATEADLPHRGLTNMSFSSRRELINMLLDGQGAGHDDVDSDVVQELLEMVLSG